MENIISEVAAKSPQTGDYVQNIMKLVAVMAEIPSLSNDRLKKAAVFVAFYDNDVAKGFKKTLSEDKSVGFTRRAMLTLVPMDFIPNNAKKMLIKEVSKHFVLNHVSRELFGTAFKSLSGGKNGTQGSRVS